MFCFLFGKRATQERVFVSDLDFVALTFLYHSPSISIFLLRHSVNLLSHAYSVNFPLLYFRSSEKVSLYLNRKGKVKKFFFRFVYSALVGFVWSTRDPTGEGFENCVFVFFM